MLKRITLFEDHKACILFVGAHLSKSDSLFGDVECVCVWFLPPYSLKQEVMTLQKGMDLTLYVRLSKLLHTLHQQIYFSRIVLRMKGNKLTHLKCSQHTIDTFYQIL